ncbi:uncharacterized protein LOC126474376 [Schistocerca serialis cubense]|uniref:uncharacterized protein LOC126474376 n=1 Tax=Schistocerca serialis cubense TaxID=2023355 RepID=UPI00214F108B|nr:uncharacterized protein LOC126474376 [Schistocerca serialis cubense]
MYGLFYFFATALITMFSFLCTFFLLRCLSRAHITLWSRKRLRKRTVLIGVWNIQGLQNKVGEVIKEMEARNQDIIILPETKKKGRGIERIGSYTHFYSGVPKNQRAKRVISILMKNKFKRMVTNWEPIDENLIKINIDIHGYKITIIGVYGISEDEPICKKDDFYNNLNGIIEDIGKTREIIIAGDFNSRTGSKIGNKIIGPFGENVINDNGKSTEENRNCPIENIQTEIKIPKYNLNSFENESTIFLYQKRLDEKLVETEFDNTEDQYHYIVNKLHEATKEALGETEETRTNHPLYYWNEEIKKEVKLKKEKYLKWLNTRNLQDKIELNAQQAKIRKKVAEAKNKVWEQEEYLGNPEYNEMIDLQAENYIRLEIETVKTAIKSLKN